MLRRNNLCYVALSLWPLSLSSQTGQQLSNIMVDKTMVDKIMQRLDRVEGENRSLSEEVRGLRAELAAIRESKGAVNTAEPANVAALEERLEIQQQRLEEQAQTKVEGSQKFPIRLTGMALFNAFLNSKQSGGSEYPVVASAAGPGTAGGTLRQTIVGLEFRGPAAVWGGKVQGSLYMDFFAVATNNSPVRVRTGSIEVDWKSRSIMMGLEKPIFNPREPSSLAQVGISPLTGAGNLWLWLPQVRAEQDFHFGAATGLRAQMGVVQTREIGPFAGTASTEAVRPGLEGRFNFFHNLDDERRLEFAPGFHTSTTHAGGQSIPSNVFSLDWFFNPWRRVELTGAFFTGQNVALLGSGTRQGFAVDGLHAYAVQSKGGWGQVTLRAAPRLDFHVFTGQVDDASPELRAGAIGNNLLFGANTYFHLAPNVLLGLELTQLRTMYFGQGTRINNHYDLALGYLF